MAMMFANLYTALVSAGVPDEKAQRAAEEMAAANTSFDVGQLRTDVTELKSEFRIMRAEIGAVKSDVAVLKWMLGFLLASVIGGFAVVIRFVAH